MAPRIRGHVFPLWRNGQRSAGAGTTHLHRASFDKHARVIQGVHLHASSVRHPEELALNIDNILDLGSARRAVGEREPCRFG